MKNIGIDTKIEIYLGDGPFLSYIGIVNLHPLKRTHWICYLNETYFDNYGVVCAKKLFKNNKKRNGDCLFSEYQIQKMIVFVQVFFIYNLSDKSDRY